MHSSATQNLTDRVPRDCPGAREIGFTLPERYNASAILFDNLAARGERIAVTGPAGSRTYAELCGDAAQFGRGLLELALERGDRVLMFLDDTPAYPAALFGALRAGLAARKASCICSTTWRIRRRHMHGMFCS